jgi:hypothetical protein
MKRASVFGALSGLAIGLSVIVWITYLPSSRYDPEIFITFSWLLYPVSKLVWLAPNEFQAPTLVALASIQYSAIAAALRYIYQVLDKIANLSAAWV